MSRAIAFLLVLTGSAFPYLKAYEVLPKTAQWAGVVYPDRGVAELVTCNFDTPMACEYFTGKGDTAEYQVSMLTYPGAVPCVGTSVSLLRA